jgi:RNA polymerase sigma-70 factor, ECF subfamily
MTLKQIYAEHARYVWRVLRRLGVPEANAADATQDVFVVVHRRLGEFEGRARMTTWLFQICLRVASDRRKSARRRPEILDESLLEAAVDGAPDALAGVQQRERLALLEQALDAMDFDQRVVFTMFELEEMSGEQISEALLIPLGTVYSRLRLGRQAFSQALLMLQARRRFEPALVGGKP